MRSRSHRIRTAFESALVVSPRPASAAQPARGPVSAGHARLRAPLPGTIAPRLSVERRWQQLDPIGVQVSVSMVRVISTLALLRSLSRPAKLRFA